MCMVNFQLNICKLLSIIILFYVNQMIRRGQEDGKGQIDKKAIEFQE